MTDKTEAAALQRVADALQTTLLQHLAENPADSAAAHQIAVTARDARLKDAATLWKTNAGPIGAAPQNGLRAKVPDTGPV